jgi:hypothetical protein
MIVAHDCRLIMGPGRQGEVYGVVALVPDGKEFFLSFPVRTNGTRSNERGSVRQSILGL